MLLSLKMALRSIGANKLRAALTMLGIIIGVLALVVLVSLVSGTTNQALTPDECLKLDIDTANWTLKDGYYYYNRILQPGEITETLFTQVEIVGSKVDQTHGGSTLSLTVNAYAVQSENNPADFPWDASGWPAD